MPTLLGELDANRGSADPHSLNYNDEGSPLVHHVTGLDPYTADNQTRDLGAVIEHLGQAER